MEEWSLWGFWSLAILINLINFASLLMNLLLLPGNWVMAASLLIFLAGTSFDRGPTWTILFVTLALAVVGEILEMVMGSAAAAKKGASGRAMFLSLVCSFVGSIAGTFLIPIPIIGSVIGAILGAAAGAFCGAWIGEAWTGSELSKRTEVSSAAMQGRLLGMLAKFAIGTAIFLIQLLSFFVE